MSDCCFANSTSDSNERTGALFMQNIKFSKPFMLIVFVGVYVNARAWEYFVVSLQKLFQVGIGIKRRFCLRK